MPPHTIPSPCNSLCDLSVNFLLYIVILTSSFSHTEWYIWWHPCDPHVQLNNSHFSSPFLSKVLVTWFATSLLLLWFHCLQLLLWLWVAIGTVWNWSSWISNRPLQNGVLDLICIPGIAWWLLSCIMSKHMQVSFPSVTIKWAMGSACFLFFFNAWTFIYCLFSWTRHSKCMKLSVI